MAVPEHFKGRRVEAFVFSGGVLEAQSDTSLLQVNRLGHLEVPMPVKFNHLVSVAGRPIWVIEVGLSHLDVTTPPARNIILSMPLATGSRLLEVSIDDQIPRAAVA